MNSKLIEYTPEQIEKACEEDAFVYITFYDNKCMVEEVVLNKHTAKCIWPQNTTSARFEKSFIGNLYCRSVFCITGDEPDVIEAFYKRSKEDAQMVIKDQLSRIEKMDKVLEENIIYSMNPLTNKWEKING